MSERRQLTLLLVGLVLLAGVGFAGAALFPDECAGLSARGSMVLDVTDVDEALPVSAEVGASLEELAVAADAQPFRGAVALPDDTVDVLPSEAGFFVVTTTEFAVVRPGFGVVSNPRDLVGTAPLPAHRAIVLRADDGTAVMYDGELDELRCGTLAPAPDVLDVDRGVSVVRDGRDVAAVTLSGDTLWTRDLGDVAWAWVVEREVAVGTDGGVVVVSLQDGEELARFGPAGSTLVDARGERVLVDGDGGPALLDVVAREATDVEVPLPAALVPGGVRAIGDGVAIVPGGSVVADGVAVVDLVTSDDGVLGLVVEVDGRRALLQYGPVSDLQDS